MRTGVALGQNLISIHAPREGGDAPASWATPRSPGFQSTPPARGATMIWMIRQVELVFQSTPPARGATPIFSLHYCIRIISIHAPREGGDGIYDLLKNALAISIHAPREGGDIII